MSDGKMNLVLGYFGMLAKYMPLTVFLKHRMSHIATYNYPANIHSFTMLQNYSWRLFYGACFLLTSSKHLIFCLYSFGVNNGSMTNCSLIFFHSDTIHACKRHSFFFQWKGSVMTFLHSNALIAKVTNIVDQSTFSQCASGLKLNALQCFATASEVNACA